MSSASQTAGCAAAAASPAQPKTSPRSPTSKSQTLKPWRNSRSADLRDLCESFANSAVKGLIAENAKKSPQTHTDHWNLCKSVAFVVLLIDRYLDDLILDRVGHKLRLVVDIQFAHQVE